MDNILEKRTQIAILAVGASLEGYKKINDTFKEYHYVNVTLTADHRAIDGAGAAEFLAHFKIICEEEF